MMATSQVTDAGKRPTDVDDGRDAYRARMRAEVRASLNRRPRELPAKYFYDERGSALFEEITRLPEYYLTAAERSLLDRHAPDLVARLQPRTLVELGAGSAAKTRVVLDAMSARSTADLYVPIDVSAEFLEATAGQLRAEYAGLEVHPVVSDVGVALAAPEARPRPTLFAFLGSTIGNFEAPAAIALLRRVRAAMEPADRILLGVDLHKDRPTLEAAYNDAREVTADFNRNILRVLNRDLAADFDPDAFEHHAFYDDRLRRIEMRLVAARDQRVAIPGIGEIHFLRGESIRTEISSKYTRDAIQELLTASRLELRGWLPDPDGRFALALGAPV